MTPTSPPIRIPIETATAVDHPALMPRAVITPVKAIADPTDKSIPPLMMIMVMPMAPIDTMTVCAKTVRRFLSEIFLGSADQNREDNNYQKQTQEWR
jgi:hypothetical protein